MAKAMYVHVPFCETICAYCDFGRCKMNEALANRWLKTIEEELTQRTFDETLTTLYIGGGTPTALSVHQLEELLQLLDPYTKELTEYTIEANPENLTEEKLAVMVRHGVNRLSLGVQSFNPTLIKIIGRAHDSAMIDRRLDQIHRAGIHNVSIDLMYGLPKQTLDNVRQDLNKAANDVRITHISIYSLTIEEHSAFGRQQVEACDNELEGQMYELICQQLAADGYEHYEISNFARPGYESKHNQMYWHYEDYIGLGCGASGKEHHVRYDRPFQLNKYLNHCEQAEIMTLSREEEQFEFVMMGLRMRQGISLLRYEALFGESLLDHYQNVIDKHCKKGWLLLENGYLAPSEAGMCFLNEILLDFMD